MNPPDPDLEGRADVRFVGTATTLIELGGFRVLTDPNFLHAGQFAYLGYGLVSRRRTEPAMQPADLPTLDLVLLSHLHGDHFDRIARRGLDPSVRLATTEQAARKLRRRGFRRARGFAPWSAASLERDGSTLRVTAVPGHHAHGALETLLPDVTGFVLELSTAGRAEPALRVYVTGDTLMSEDLAQIPERFPFLDAAIVHLGGTRIAGFLVTMNDVQGVQLLDLIRPAVALPVHHDDYGVFRSSLEDFERRRREVLPHQRVVALARGERTTIVPARSTA
jgi:L-ascorbate metabolism protein UlaG (beta-lactamase superfamily)